MLANAHFTRKTRDSEPAGLANMRAADGQNRHAARIKKPPEPGPKTAFGTPADTAATAPADTHICRPGVRVTGGKGRRGLIPAADALRGGGGMRRPDQKTPESGPKSAP